MKGDALRLDRSHQMFPFCSYERRDARRGEEPWLEGAYALRPRLSREHQVHSEVRLHKQLDLDTLAASRGPNFLEIAPAR
jgi:hypothetical protein